jgi:hypothetical protein
MRLLRLAARITAASVLTICVAAPPAHGAVQSMTAGLTVTDAEPTVPGSTYWDVKVVGVVRTTTQQDVTELKGSGHRVIMRLWGDDPSYDDLLRGPFEATYFGSSLGLGFTAKLRMRGIDLDEDIATLDPYIPGTDELYVGVRLVNSQGATVRLVETNRVRGNF